MLIFLNVAGSILRSSRRFSSTTKIIVKESLPAVSYNPELVEKNKYAAWERSGLFSASVDNNAPKFSMVLPPPNVTGRLHLGHALACTVQDVIARIKKAQGFNVLWVPGMDHAGIATQGVVERYLQSTRNIDRHRLGPVRFKEEVWRWKDEHGETIVNQLKMLGCSLDWSREVFTMSPEHTHAVNVAFKRLFDRHVIYRKTALVNWCRALKSTISDIEVDSLELNDTTNIYLPGYKKPVTFGRLYSILYKVYNGNEEIVVATTQPETMLGDSAIAVHPNDDRYKHLQGKHVINPATGRPIPIVFDDFVDMNFGTGAVKITPAHNKVDYEIAKEHNLPIIQVINEEGVMENSDQYNGLKRYECREMLLDKLEQTGALTKIAPHTMVLPVCSRTGDVIDYLPKEQWFISCSSMNEMAAEMVRGGQLKIEPPKFVDNWLQWCSDDRDWCISRQLWWGHQVPAYNCYCTNLGNNNAMWVAAENPDEARQRAAVLLKTQPETVIAERDKDVLDTWFSSAIYPFAGLGWPDHHYKKDYNKFYPLDLMVSGHDILGFWVHRMVMLGLELTERLPFPKVLLHGIICDNKGAKMSKSKGNVIDPLDVIEGITLKQLENKTIDMKHKGILSATEVDKALSFHKANYSNTNGIPQCGVDALRFTLLSHDIKSHFVNFDMHMCHANKLFCNKIWQSVKYLQLCFGKLKKQYHEVSEDDLSNFDKWILSRLQNMVMVVNQSNETADFHLSTKALRKFLYNELCDVYLESTKPAFKDGRYTLCYGHAHTLSACLHTGLRCLSPYMIYLTDELIPKIPSFENNIIYNPDDNNKPIFSLPKHEDFKEWENPYVEKKVEKVLSTASLIRELKSLCGMSGKVEPTVCVQSADIDLKIDLETYKPVLLKLSNCSDLVLDDIDCNNKKYVKGFVNFDTLIGVEIISDDVDKTIAMAKNKLQMKIAKLEQQLAKLEAKQSTKSYSLVPENTRNIERQKLLDKQQELRRLQTDLGRLTFENMDIKTKVEENNLEDK